jgi:nucleolar protein 56
MTDRSGDAAGWTAGLSADAADRQAAAAIREGAAPTPADWPAQAVESGFAESEAAYYDALQAATIAASEAAVREHESASDRRLIHAVRAMDDCASAGNELVERVADWGGDVDGEAVGGPEYARAVAARKRGRPGPDGTTTDADGASTDADGAPTDTPAEREATDQLIGLAESAVDLLDRREALRAFLERQAPAVAPNLSTLAGPVLAARLIALAGGLEDLAKLPSGTVQVLGAEDALFAHLRGDAPSPKHGVIYTHEYVQGTRREKRGSAARALAGKLSIAARVDHYAGDRRPELERELDERIEQVRHGDGGASE